MGLDVEGPAPCEDFKFDEDKDDEEIDAPPVVKS